MKDLQIFILLFLGFHNILSGQSSILDSTYTWTEANYLGHTGELYTKKYRLSSNVVMHGNKSYYEILYSDSLINVNWYATSSQIRFDSNRIWKYGLPSEYILLDFNLKVNDVFTDVFGSEMTVTSVDSITLLNGDRRKRLEMDCDVGPIYWIEGIGSTAGLDISFGQCLIDAGSLLLCVSRNDTLLYQDLQFNTCWLTTLSTANTIPENITIYPNPVNERLEIKDPDQMMVSFYLYNSMGQYMYNGTKNEVDFNRFSPGCYLMKIACKNGKMINKLIIKQ